jgi:hypothetical protein
MTLRSRHIVPVVLAVFVIGIGGTMIFNLWQTTSSKVPATYTEGEFAGEYNPADIRGSYSFGDIEEAFSVPVEALARAFAVADTEDPAAFLCKSLEELYGEMDNGEIGTDSVRWFVALFTGLPYTPEEDTLLPEAALPTLRGRLSEAELDVVGAKTASLSAPTSSTLDAAAADAQAATESDSHTEHNFRGARLLGGGQRHDRADPGTSRRQGRGHCSGLLHRERHRVLDGEGRPAGGSGCSPGRTVERQINIQENEL